MDSHARSGLEVLVETFVGYEQGKCLVSVLVGPLTKGILEIWVLIHIIVQRSEFVFINPFGNTRMAFSGEMPSQPSSPSFDIALIITPCLPAVQVGPLSGILELLEC